MHASRRAERGRTLTVEVIAALTFLATLLIWFGSHAAGAATPPAVGMTPSGTLTSGQTVAVSVGPNGYFTPNSDIKILECADPGGSSSNLPTDDTSCDGNTVQGGSLIVDSDGSFSDPTYTVFLLPSSTLGEPGDNVPVCNQSHYCVLYIGQDQNDFTKPKAFSAPFLVTTGSGGASTTTNTASGTSGSSGTNSQSSGTTTSHPTSSASPSGATGAPSQPTTAATTLANTGKPADVVWIAASGLILLLVGMAGRRLALRGGP